MPDGFHPPVEEYLEAIYGLMEEGTPVIQARLVERLGYSPQAVSEMVHRLVDDGYLELDGRDLVLSEKGEKQAESIIRRHRLAERFLVDVVGLPWVRAHLEAGRWEHVISNDVEARFIELLGNPATCPHGNPIPGCGVEPEPQVAMTTLEEGQRVRLVRITERIENDWTSLSYLAEHGLVPGRVAKLKSRAPDGTLTFELEATTDQQEGTVAIGAQMATQLYVAT